MALVTAAIAAVTAAVATTTVATVAAAAVAVSALVGAVGLAVTAVGLVTKNQTLTKVGGIMGMVGLAGGIAGYAAGSLAPAVASAGTTGAEGAGSLFAPPEGGYGAAQAVGQGTVLAPPAAPPVGTETVLAPVQERLGQGLINMTQNNLATSQQMAGITPPSALPAGSELSSMAQTPVAPGAPAAPSGPMAPGAPGADPFGVTSPVTSGSASAPGSMDTLKQLLPSGATQPPAGGIAEWWNNLPDSMKAAISVTGGQTLAGTAGGLFQGMAASDRLELEKLINQQRQNQVDLQNKNASYAPRVTFGRGLINMKPA